MIRRAYLLVYYLLILALLLATAVVVIASHPKTIPYLAEKFLKPEGIRYSTIEGSLLQGVTLHDIRYKDALAIRRLELKYNILMLLKPTPAFKSLKLEEVTIRPDKLQGGEEGGEVFALPAFALAQLQLKDTRLIVKDEEFLLDLNASKIKYRSHLNVKGVALLLHTDYGDATLRGEIRSDRLYAESSITPTAAWRESYLTLFEDLPRQFDLHLEAGLEEIMLHTRLERLKLKEHNATIAKADMTLSYLPEQEHFTLNVSYRLLYDGLAVKISQNGLFTPSGVYTSKLNASILDTPLTLPFDRFDAEISGDRERMLGRLDASELAFTFNTDDYEHFSLHAHSKALPLSFLPDLPDLLKDNRIAFSADAILESVPFGLKGSFDAEGSHCGFTGSFEADGNTLLFLTTLNPKPLSDLWQEYPVEKFSPVNLVYYKDPREDILNLDANLLNLTLFKTGKDLNGWGNIASGHFDTQGRLADNNETRIDLTADIPSVHTLMSEFGFNTPEPLLVDARADINATMTLGEKMILKSRVHLPWYIIQADTQTSYQGEDVSLESTLSDGRISIDRYSLSIKGHRVYSQRPSQIAFDSNGTLLLREFWVYDNLLLSGKLAPAQMRGKLHLQSERFDYEGSEGNISLKADLRAEFGSDGHQNIEGEITLLEGEITYEPKTDYTISDDVIIIQDIKPRSSFKRSVNVHINSLKPIGYKTKEVDLLFTPDIILWQEPDTPLGIYGIVTIEDGQVIGGGKLFELDKSEIYFNGSYPVNPNLNLNIRHTTLDYKEIEIYITNTLSSPVVILASNPAMSQNDIMSYILFGEPASSAFSSSDEGSKTIAVSSLLLATGLKQIFNESAGVNIDTLNILTNEEGTLGYEIGTRFGKQIRVLYKNDTVSSVTLQYSLSRSIRLDIDVHETGQGVSILYVKDF